MANHDRNHDDDEHENEHDNAYSPRSSPSASHSPTHSHAAPSTTVTTPEQSSGSDDDIWATSSVEEGFGGGGGGGEGTWLGGRDNDNDNDQSRPINTTTTMTTDDSNHDRQSHQLPRERILSDIPTLRRQHMTDGYREGLSIGKAQVMQEGFDVGYPVGVEIGMRVGVILGVLEGILAAVVRKQQQKASTSGGGGGGAKKNSSAVCLAVGVDQTRLNANSSGTSTNISPTSSPNSISNPESILTKLLERAKSQLAITELMKCLDDEKVARLDENTINSNAGSGGSLPAEIEQIVSGWDKLITDALGGKDDVLQQKQ
ncbi:hypothetical protein PV10_08906 [Exophiala mesophila]|uniref:Protein YAE1 n=1 Tax=Exophiala mesophila TaxID=212818 RepID=A0A0D1WK67_EXOME|nr:uncharacterized protein PV10_08906 [Exophiala mesophila]KIV89330.1 hypothetical protein PV10_08906 [Exophiala mesophila]